MPYRVQAGSGVFNLPFKLRDGADLVNGVLYTAVTVKYRVNNGTWTTLTAPTLVAGNETSPVANGWIPASIGGGFHYFGVPSSLITVPSQILIAVTGSTFDQVEWIVDVLAEIPTAEQNADAVRTELTTELEKLDATVSSRSVLTDQQVWNYTERALTDFDFSVDISSVTGTAVTSVDDFKADISNLATSTELGDFEQSIISHGDQHWIDKSLAGPGATYLPWTIKSEDDVELPAISVWISDGNPYTSGNTVAGTLYTSETGLVEFYLEPDTVYYGWRASRNYNFPNPITFQYNSSTLEWEILEGGTFHTWNLQTSDGISVTPTPTLDILVDGVAVPSGYTHTFTTTDAVRISLPEMTNIVYNYKDFSVAGFELVNPPLPHNVGPEGHDIWIRPVVSAPGNFTVNFMIDNFLLNLVNTVPAEPYVYTDYFTLCKYFGKVNVDSWADMDSSKNPNEVQMHVAQVCYDASRILDSMIKRGSYSTPFEPTYPVLITKLASYLAWNSLYFSSGKLSQQFDIQFATYRKYVQVTVENINRGAIALEGVPLARQSINAPNF